MKYLFVIISLIFVVSCATPKYNYTPDVTLISEPPLNSEAVAFVGDKMVSQGNISTIDGIRFNEPQRISGYSFSSGFLTKTGEDEKSSFYSFVQSTSKQPTASGLATMSQNFLVDPLQSVEVIKESRKVCAVTVFNLKACRNDIQYSEDVINNANSNSFQQTLLYSGRIGNKINIGYREFSGNAARPAFNNDVEYDLTTSSTIAYKGAFITVLEADNQKIRYIVNKNFVKSEF